MQHDGGLRGQALADRPFAMQFRFFIVCAIALVLVGCAGSNGDHGRTTETDLAGYQYPSRSIPGRRPDQGDFVLVDKSDRALTVFRNGHVLQVFYGLQFGDAPIGHKQFEGDERTPEGFYTIDLRNPQSSYFLSLRINYPNANDNNFAQQYGRSAGGDIYIHGQPNGMNYGRMQGDWTDGCIALSNEEISELWGLIADGTPIEIRR